MAHAAPRPASDRRIPGPSFLALLAAPGLVYWAAFAYLLLFARGSHWTIGLVVNPLLAVACLGAGVAAPRCRGPRLFRWGVCVMDCAPTLVIVCLFASFAKWPSLW